MKSAAHTRTLKEAARTRIASEAAALKQEQKHENHAKAEVAYEGVCNLSLDVPIRFQQQYVRAHTPYCNRACTPSLQYFPLRIHHVLCFLLRNLLLALLLLLLLWGYVYAEWMQARRAEAQQRGREKVAAAVASAQAKEQKEKDAKDAYVHTFFAAPVFGVIELKGCCFPFQVGCRLLCTSFSLLLFSLPFSTKVMPNGLQPIIRLLQHGSTGNLG